MNNQVPVITFIKKEKGHQGTQLNVIMIVLLNHNHENKTHSLQSRSRKQNISLAAIRKRNTRTALFNKM